MKKNLKFIILSAISLLLAAYCFYKNLTIDRQLAYIGVVLPAVNLIMALMVFKRQKQLSYIFVSTSLIIESFLLVNIFWILRLGRIL